MKSNSLQFGKAMSAALFVLLLSVVGMKNALAQTQVATLQHGDDISVFYGTNAFVEAHTAAVDGDIVTLSGGSFNSPTITKAITLRGAGMLTDLMANIAPTILAQEVTIDVTNDSVPFQVEGVLFSNKMNYHKMNNPKFTRCGFNEIAESGMGGSYANMRNAQFVNCMIKEASFKRAYNTTLINSVVWDVDNITTDYTVMLYNSVLRYYSGQSSNYPKSYNGLTAYNSIIIKYGNCASYNCMGSTCMFSNCIAIKNNNTNVFGSGYTFNCVVHPSYTDVFDNFTGTFSYEEPYVLNEDIATGFLGSDGTQVGIYGGFMPYSNRPSYMVMKRCNVANKSTIDGNLSVDIEVVTEEE